jgi:hypothetical protein
MVPYSFDKWHAVAVTDPAFGHSQGLEAARMSARAVAIVTDATAYIVRAGAGHSVRSQYQLDHPAVRGMGTPEIVETVHPPEAQAYYLAHGKRLGDDDGALLVQLRDQLRAEQPDWPPQEIEPAPEPADLEAQLSASIRAAGGGAIPADPKPLGDLPTVPPFDVSESEAHEIVAAAWGLLGRVGTTPSGHHYITHNSESARRHWTGQTWYGETWESALENAGLLPLRPLGVSEAEAKRHE